MERRQIVIIAATVTVFAWSVVMVVIGGEVAAVITLAPVLGLTVQQIVRAARSQTTPASGHRVAAVPDQEDGAP